MNAKRLSLRPRRAVLPVVLAAVGLLPWSSGFGADTGHPDLAAEVDVLRKEYKALQATRTRMVEALVRRQQGIPPERLPVTVTAAEAARDPAAAARRVATLATHAYEEARAAALCHRYEKLSFGEARRLTALPGPKWGATQAQLGVVALPEDTIDVDLDKDRDPREDQERADAIIDALTSGGGRPIRRPSYPTQYGALTVADVQAITAYVRNLHALMTDRLRSADAAATAYVVGSEPMSDPFFGPYYDDLPLPADADGLVRLPPDAGTDGPPAWHYIPAWQAVGPFPPDSQPDLATPLLPEIVPAFPAAYLPDLSRLGEWYERPGDGLLRWSRQTALNRYLPPPGHRMRLNVALPQPDGPRLPPKTLGVHGATRARWYAFARVLAERDVELYMSARVHSHGKLWVNNRLAWMSGQTRFAWPRKGNVEARHPPIFRVRLKKGVNELLLACQCRGRLSHASLLLCTRGKPMSPERRAAWRRLHEERARTKPPDHRRGRRQNFNGRFPDADPPLWWDVKTGVNVRWRTPMPSFSGANPVITGDRLLVTCQPHTLFCLDKHTGDILWQRDSHVCDFAPEAERERARKAWDEGYAAAAGSEDDNMAREIAGMERSLAALKDSGKATEEAIRAAEARIAEKKRTAMEARTIQKPYRSWCERLGVREAEWGNCFGWAYSAPVTDGTNVWVKYGTGVAACYDLDGNRQWIAHTRMSSGGSGDIPSPLLLGGNMILQGVITEPARLEAMLERMPDALPGCDHVIMALDALTGEEKWVRPIPVQGGYGAPAGICPLRLSNGKQVREIIVTANSLLLDPVDGRPLCDPTTLGVTSWYQDPFVVGNRIYWFRMAAVRAAEAWLEDDGRVGAKVVLVTDQGTAKVAPTYMDGCLFWNSSRNFNSRGQLARVPVMFQHFMQCDARTGKALPTIERALPDGGGTWTPTAVAGSFAVVTGTGPSPGSWNIPMNCSAQIGFMRPGPNPYVVSTVHVTEPMVAQPVFEGNRMYLRTYKSVMCMAADTKEGRDIMLRKKAEATLNALPASPLRYGIWQVPPVPGFERADADPVTAFESVTSPRRWLFAGPFALPADTGSLRDAAAAVTSLPDAPAALTVADNAFAFRPLPDNAATAEGLDVLGPLKGEAAGCFYTLLYSDGARIVHISLTHNPNARVWMAGQWIRDDNTIRLKRGMYPVAVIARAPADAASAGNGRVLLKLTESDAFRKWKPLLRRHRERIAEVVRDLPGTEMARTAKDMLDAIE